MGPFHHVPMDQRFVFLPSSLEFVLLGWKWVVGGVRLLCKFFKPISLVNLVTFSIPKVILVRNQVIYYQQCYGPKVLVYISNETLYLMTRLLLPFHELKCSRIR